MSILTLNCGSSSVKYACFEPANRSFVCRGLVDRVGQPGTVLKQSSNSGEVLMEQNCPDHAQAVALVLKVLTQGTSPALADLRQIQGVGHRVVHGGEKFSRSAMITEEMLRVVEELSQLAPLHNPPNLAGIRATSALLPEVPQVAVFDTAFHQTMDPSAFLYPLPYSWYEQHGIRRYGFHGTSHLYVAHRAAALLGRPLADLKLVTLHLGNGASAAAVQGGRSVDTSMGFTPLEGLVMGTRSGWIDPAIPLFVMQKENVSVEAMDRVLNKQSGLLGITGRFSDRRDIERAAQQGDRRCQLAMEIEIRAIKKTIAAYAAVMSGLDAVVFTAGVGENSVTIRERTLTGLEFMGISVDAKRNRLAVGGEMETIISKEGSRAKAAVIPTNEELVIAEDTLALLESRFDPTDHRYSFSQRPI